MKEGKEVVGKTRSNEADVKKTEEVLSKWK